MRRCLDPAFVVREPVENLHFDLPIVEVAGKVYFGGEPAAILPTCRTTAVRVTFQENRTGTLQTYDILCTAEDLSFRMRLPPGEYSAHVSTYDGPATRLPYGYLVADPALRVSGPISSLALEPRTIVHVSGELLLNGAAPVIAPGCSGSAIQLTFYGKKTGSVVTR